MTHATDDELILRYYGELTDAKVTRHTDACAECSARLQALAESLALTDTDQVPERPASYEADVWGRLEWRLQKRARNRSAWLAAAAALILIALGFLAGRTSLPPSTVPEAQVATTPQSAPGAGNEAIAAAALSHLDRSGRLLVQVSNHDTVTGGELDSAGGEDLVASNRLMRLMATRAGEREIAALLEEIEPVLLEVVHTGEETTSEDIAMIQQRIARRELLFKVRVITSALRARELADRRRPATEGNTL